MPSWNLQINMKTGIKQRYLFLTKNYITEVSSGKEAENRDVGSYVKQEGQQKL